MLCTIIVVCSSFEWWTSRFLLIKFKNCCKSPRLTVNEKPNQLSKPSFHGKFIAPQFFFSRLDSIPIQNLLNDEVEREAFQSTKCNKSFIKSFMTYSTPFSIDTSTWPGGFRSIAVLPRALNSFIRYLLFRFVASCLSSRMHTESQLECSRSTVE